MKVEEDKCIGCLECVDYCPVNAIKAGDEDGRVFIDEEECVECGCCLRVEACEYEALWQPDLQWPRILRAQFSDPCVKHASGSGSSGRGTSEIKNNDVTGRYPLGSIGIAAEIGRPGTGTRMDDIEKVAQAVLSLGVELEKENPTYNLFEDPASGKLREDIRGEKVLSAILEFKTTEDKAPDVLKALSRISSKVDTVFSVDIASMMEPDGGMPAERVAEKAGFRLRPNGKNNLGLGRYCTEINETVGKNSIVLKQA